MGLSQKSPFFCAVYFAGLCVTCILVVVDLYRIMGKWSLHWLTIRPNWHKIFGPGESAAPDCSQYSSKTRGNVWCPRNYYVLQFKNGMWNMCDPCLDAQMMIWWLDEWFKSGINKQIFAVVSGLLLVLPDNSRSHPTFNIVYQSIFREGTRLEVSVLWN